MTLSDFSLKNPVFAVMLSAAMVVFGYLGYRDMGISQFPEIDFPVVSITTYRDAADPEPMDFDVTDVIEDAISSVEGIDYVQSTSSPGVAVTTVFFRLSRDVDAAMQDVQNAVSAAANRLPNDVDPPIISKVNFNKFPVIWLSVHGNRPIQDLNDVVDTQLKQQIETIPGCGGVMYGGLRPRNMRVWLDGEKLQAYNLDPLDVTRALRAEHVEKPAGYIKSQKRELNVRVMGEARTPEEFAKMPVVTRGNQIIRLGDVAVIEDGLSDKRNFARFNRMPNVGVGVMRATGANVVQVCDEVKARLPALRKQLPEGVEISISTDYSLFIKEDIKEVNNSLLYGIILTAIVTYFFLGSVGTTFNVCISIPTSLIGTFMAMKWCGFTINFMTLLALSLSVGVVVDDAILVLENIYRRMEHGEDRKTASLRGAREISFAAIAATLSIAAIFIPVAFMQGAIGRFFFQFGITCTVAVLLSLVISLTITPVLCSAFLTLQVHQARLPNRYSAVLFPAFALAAAYAVRTWLASGMGDALLTLAVIAGGLTLASFLVASAAAQRREAARRAANMVSPRRVVRWRSMTIVVNSSARRNRKGYNERRMRSAEEKGAKGVAPRGNAGFSQDDGGFRPPWRFWGDFAVFSSQGALRWGSPCVDAFPPDSRSPSVVLVHATGPLFAWGELEDVPRLLTIEDVLSSLPDEALLGGPREARGRGRDDCPAEALRGVVPLSILCRHLHAGGCLGELQRNPTLCALIGIDSPCAIPRAWNVSRFLDVLGCEPHLSNGRAVFDALVERPGQAAPGLGEHAAGDGAALAGRAKKDARAAALETKQGLPQPTGGRKEYKGEGGKVTKVREWFGYELHPLVDADSEVSLAYAITDTKAGDDEPIEAPALQAEANPPEDRIETLAYDKAADDGKAHQTLREHGVEPVIQIRATWKDEKEKVVRFGLPMAVHDEAGTVFCYDTPSGPPTERKMTTYVGHEQGRGTARHRCPAAYEGFSCESQEKCNAGKKQGLGVRIKCGEDLRRFPAAPRGTGRFEGLYKGRTAAERVNARSKKTFWGVGR